MGSFSLFHMMIFLIILLPIYFAPSIVAVANRHPKRLFIILLNIVLGWSGIGWLGALVWSLIPGPRTGEGL